MNPKGLIGGIAAGVLGALVWAGVVVATEYEIGWLAWGIGLAVGFGVVMLGGRGPAMGVAAGAIAFLSIIGGKAIGTSVMISNAESEIADGLGYTAEDHELFMADAQEYATLGPGQEVAFMKNRPPYDFEPDGVIDEEERAFFNEFWKPRLQGWAAQPVGYQEWNSQLTSDMAASIQQDLQFGSVFKEAFAPMDIVFFLLGVVTAFGIVARQEDEQPQQGPYPGQPVPGHAPPPSLDAQGPPNQPQPAARPQPPRPGAQPPRPRMPGKGAQARPSVPVKRPGPANAPQPQRRRPPTDQPPGMR